MAAGKRQDAEELNSDEDLEWDNKKRDHKRDQVIKNVGSSIFVVLLILLPLALFIFFVLIVAHYFYIGEWETGANITGYVATASTSYFAGVMKKIGIDHK